MAILLHPFKGSPYVTQTSGYGNRTRNGKKEFHAGVDLVTNNGEKTLVALAPGKVYDNYRNNDRGWVIKVQMLNGEFYLYQHLASQSPVAKGTQVKIGDVLGKMGNTGDSDGAHLHLEYQNTNQVHKDPWPLLRGEVKGIIGDIPKTNKEKLWTYLTTPTSDGGCGCSAIGAAAVIGNFTAECGGYINHRDLEPNLAEVEDGLTYDYCSKVYYTKVNSGEIGKNSFVSKYKGFGICQWTTQDRKLALWNYWKTNFPNKGIEDMEMQSKFLWQEMKKSPINGKNIQQMLQNMSGSIRDAVKTLHDNFIMSADWQENRTSQINVRYTQAEKAYKDYLDKNFILDWSGISSGYSTKTLTIEDYLQLDGTESWKYNLPNTIKKCYMTNHTTYKNKFPLTPQKSKIMVNITDRVNGNLASYIWPGEDDPDYNNLVSILGDYKSTHWNYDSPTSKSAHVFIGKTASNQVASLQTMPFDYQANYRNDANIKSHYIQVVLCNDWHDQDYWVNGKGNQELMEVLIHLCCAFQINPEKEGNIVSYDEYVNNTINTDMTNLRKKIKGVIMGEIDNSPTTTALTETAIGELLSMSYETFKDKYLKEYLNSKKKSKPSPYSKDARYWCEANEIILGYEEPFDFRYPMYITREDIALIVSRALNYYQKEV